MKCFVAVKRVVDYSVKVRVNAAKNAVEIANVCVPSPSWRINPFSAPGTNHPALFCA